VFPAAVWLPAFRAKPSLILNLMAFPQWPFPENANANLSIRCFEHSVGGYHPIVGEFEKRFAAFQHCAYGLAAMNGTVTLEMALASLGIGAGDEVIVPAISFISSATAVSRWGPGRYL